MKQITNRASRRLGVPGRPALILDPDETQLITEEQLSEIRKNRMVSRWLERGVLVVAESDGKSIAPPKSVAKIIDEKRVVPNRNKREPEVLPEGVSDEGVVCHHVGGGWWDVYVNGFKVTTDKVRKAEANEIASEYESNAADG